MVDARRLDASRGAVRRSLTTLVTLCLAGAAVSGSQVVLPAAQPGAARQAVQEAQSLSAPPLAIEGEGSLMPSSSGLPRVTGHTARTVEGIPETAFQAYRRAAEVMAASAPKCRLEWSLIAAIGQVQSRHGTVGGRSLDDDGVVTPALLGPALDGRDGRERVVDTDGGRLDDDRRFDRTMGPFEFTPSTWGVVGVDADSDGSRDPQSIVDSALAAAVALCGDGDDLGTTMGRKLALRGYNPDHDFATEVLALADDYEMEGVHVELQPVNRPSLFDSLDLIMSNSRIAPTTPAGGATTRPSGTRSAVPTPVASPSPTRTTSPSPTPSGRPTPSSGPTTGPTGAASPSGSPSPSGSSSPSGSASPSGSPSPSGSASPSGSPSGSPSPSGTPSPVDSPSPTGTPCPSPSPTDGTSPSPTPTPSPSASPSDAPSCAA